MIWICIKADGEDLLIVWRISLTDFSAKGGWSPVVSKIMTTKPLKSYMCCSLAFWKQVIGSGAPAFDLPLALSGNLSIQWRFVWHFSSFVRFRPSHWQLGLRYLHLSTCINECKSRHCSLWQDYSILPLRNVSVLSFHSFNCCVRPYDDPLFLNMTTYLHQWQHFICHGISLPFYSLLQSMWAAWLPLRKSQDDYSTLCIILGVCLFFC